MGKAKPRHKNNRRRNKSIPSGIQSVKDTVLKESELNSSTDDERVLQNIIEELQSPNVEDKLCGLQSLITLAEKPQAVDVILKYKVLKIIAPLLIEKNSEIRNFTAGVLRNLSASGSVEVCERLVKDDIMTPLVAILQQYNDWRPESSKEEDKDTLLQVVNILWNLCEIDETALKYFNSANLLDILLRCLDYRTVGLDLSIVVCQCLNSVSEDNPAVISALRSHEADLLSLLEVESADRKFLLLKTLVAGIVMNLNPSLSWLAAVLAVVHEALHDDVRTVVGELSSQLPLDKESLPSAETQTSLDNTVALCEAQVMALEILANLTSSQDEEMDAESEESADEDEEVVNCWSEADDTHPLGISTEIHEGVAKYKLVSAVVSKIYSLPENVMDIINTYPGSRILGKRAVRLQCRAFLCLNNLVSVVDIDQFGGVNRIYSLIKRVFSQRLCLNISSESNTELVEASTAAIRAILIRLASNRYYDLGEEVRLGHSSDLELIFKIGLISCEPQVQANVIRIVGTMGVILVKNNNLLLVVMAANYLLDAAEKQQNLWLTAEALDSLMDVFAEDITDQIAAEVKLVPRLQALAPRLKSKVRQERRTLGDHYPVVSTAMTNLIPFIKYKGARVAALGKT